MSNLRMGLPTKGRLAEDAAALLTQAGLSFRRQNRSLFARVSELPVDITFLRLKANAVLEREIEHLLTRPVGRPSHKPKVFYHSFQYQAKSWRHSRRVVAKVEWHAGELFPRVGFIVSNFE